MKIGNWEVSLLNSLLIFVPIAFVLNYTHASATWIFIICGLATIPMAGLLGKVTERLTEHEGSGNAVY